MPAPTELKILKTKLSKYFLRPKPPVPGVNGVGIGYIEQRKSYKINVYVRNGHSQQMDDMIRSALAEISGRPLDTLLYEIVPMQRPVFAGSLQVVDSKCTTDELKEGPYAGQSISVSYGELIRGTLGCYVKKLGDNSQDVYILSCNHVVAAFNDPNDYGSAVTTSHPKYKEFAQLDSNFSEIAGSDVNGEYIPNLIDAAIAKINSGVTYKLELAGRFDGESPKKIYGAYQGTFEVGLKVRKHGKATCKTWGSIRDEDCDFVMEPFTGGDKFLFVNQLLIRPSKKNHLTSNGKKDGSSFALPGDSGSLVVTDEPQPKAVGLLFGIGDITDISNYYPNIARSDYALLNPIGSVLDKMNLEIVT
jgi:hypothetical protein